MQLVRLTANKESFKSVHFKNEFGLNFIVAELQDKEYTKRGDSTNGVGKSLLVTIIHFCLGSSNNNAFEDKLNDWVFTLEFNINSNKYIASRACNTQNKINFNSRDISINKYKSELENLLFEIPDSVSQLSFRSLIPFFIRPRKASYTDYNNPNAVNNGYQKLITNSFLLGLDIMLIEEKYKLRKEKERVRKLVNDLSNDRLIKDFFIGKKDFSIESQNLTEQIEILEQDLKNFQVAEDYYDIKIQANTIKTKLDKIQNQIILYQNQIASINESIKFSPDIKRENIEKIYKEASAIIKDEALKQMSELESFYEHIAKNRKNRLLLQKNQLIKKIDKLSEDKENNGRQLDNKLKYLDTHQALDVFVKLTNQLSSLKSKKENITKYHDLIEEYRRERIRIDEEFIKETKKTDKYIADAKDMTDELMKFFRVLSKRFYPKSSSGITIYNNDGDNQLRYNIDARIEADASDGINSVKIFNYDLTILLKGFSHKINFLFHDSRLLDGIDPRQKAELFLILQELIKANNKQYILTMNQNQLDDTKSYLTKELFDEIIVNNTILTLKDDSPDNKLLGVQVDMHYN